MSAETVAIIDYGSGNLHSAAKAFERAAREAGLDETRIVALSGDFYGSFDQLASPYAINAQGQEMTDDPTPSPPLDADRRDRLRRLDDELCRLSPALAGCCPAPD